MQKTPPWKASLSSWKPYSTTTTAHGFRSIRNNTNRRKPISTLSPSKIIVGALIPFITFAAFHWNDIYIGATAVRAIRNTMLIVDIGVFLPSNLLLCLVMAIAVYG